VLKGKTDKGGAKMAAPDWYGRLTRVAEQLQGPRAVGAGPFYARQTIEAVMGDLAHLLFPEEIPSLPEEGGAGDLFWHLGRVTWTLAHTIHRLHPHPCPQSEQCPHMDAAAEAALHFAEGLPDLRAQLLEDAEAAVAGDPAAKSRTEVIATYPGFLAVMVYRLAHRLHRLGVPLLPRMMTEWAHSRTGIDIHPGAVIGPRFFIDHGTGVVIGETTEIGAGVTLYQGVTLGALNFPRDADGQIIRGRKRHPTIEDDVVIYAEATILGGNTVVGRGSEIGGNVWLTHSVPPGSRVVAPARVEMRSGDRQGDGPSVAAEGLGPELKKE